MKQGTVAVRYAKALFSLALEKEILEQVYIDMQSISEVLKQQEELSILMENPVVKHSEKKQLFQYIFKNRVQSITSSFLDLLITKNRQEYLLAICNSFFQQYKNYKGYREVGLVTAISPTKEFEEGLTKQIAQKLDTDIKLNTSVNPEIIGGFMLRIDDMLLDKSIATKLSDIKKQLLSK